MFLVSLYSLLWCFGDLLVIEYDLDPDLVLLDLSPPGLLSSGTLTVGGYSSTIGQLRDEHVLTYGAGEDIYS